MPAMQDAHPRWLAAGSGQVDATAAGAEIAHGQILDLLVREVLAELDGARVQAQPRRAASIVAMSIFFIVIIASNARLEAAGRGP